MVGMSTRFTYTRDGISREITVTGQAGPTGSHVSFTYANGDMASLPHTMWEEHLRSGIIVPVAEDITESFRPVTTAPMGTPCGWNAYGETGTYLTCQGGRNAIHVLTQTLPVAKAGTALCAFHSPFDPTDDERTATGQPRQTNREAARPAPVAEADCIRD